MNRKKFRKYLNENKYDARICRFDIFNERQLKIAFRIVPAVYFVSAIVTIISGITVLISLLDRGDLVINLSVLVVTLIPLIIGTIAAMIIHKDKTLIAKTSDKFIIANKTFKQYNKDEIQVIKLSNIKAELKTPETSYYLSGFKSYELLNDWYLAK